MLTLEQFVERLPLLAAAFAAAKKEHGKTDPTFNVSREETDWFFEMAAWSAVSDLQEEP
jgi:hypothetical protein